MNSQRSTFNSQLPINLHIEELVLHGFAPGDRHRIREAVEQELIRLFSEQPLPANLARNISLDRIDAGAFHLPSQARPTSVGGEIAGAIHGGLGK